MGGGGQRRAAGAATTHITALASALGKHAAAVHWTTSVLHRAMAFLGGDDVLTSRRWEAREATGGGAIRAARAEREEREGRYGIRGAVSCVTRLGGG